MTSYYRIKKYFSPIIIFLFIVSFRDVYSQGGILPTSKESLLTIQNANITAGININVSPQNPSPLSKVTLTVTTYNINLDTANLVWKIGGVVKKSGFGAKIFAFNVGKQNEKMNISVDITTNDGRNFSKNVSLNIADVDLLWEADTYTPELYKGKALLPIRGRVRVVAIPHIFSENGERVSNNNILFTWSEDGRILGSLSGLGRNTLNLRNKPKSKVREIKVSVSNIEKSTKVDRSITIPISQPEILIYEENPFFGTNYNRAISENYKAKRNSLSLIAEPFFFSVRGSLSSSIKLVWMTSSGEELTTDRKIIVSPPEKGQGISRLTVSVKSKINLMENSSKNLVTTLEKAK